MPVDHRSDIFSFGAILYELLSGRKAFKRDTASDTMAAILRDEPPELYAVGAEHLAGPRPHRPALPGEGPGEPVPVGEGHRVRAVGGIGPRRRSTSGAQARRAAPAEQEEGSHRRCGGRRSRRRGRLPPAPAARGRGRGRRRQARGGAAVREPGGSRGRLLRRRHRRRGASQADLAAGPPGDRPRQLDALQEDDQDAEADRRGAGRRRTC